MKESTDIKDGGNLPKGTPQVRSILHLNTDQSGGLPGPISQHKRDMLHTPEMIFEPSRRVGANRLIRHHERHKWQPINVSRNDVRTDVRALRLGRRLQRCSKRPLTLSRAAG